MNFTGRWSIVIPADPVQMDEVDVGVDVHEEADDDREQEGLEVGEDTEGGEAGGEGHDGGVAGGDGEEVGGGPEGQQLLAEQGDLELEEVHQVGQAEGWARRG